jgi:hypothetical protein
MFLWLQVAQPFGVVANCRGYAKSNRGFAQGIISFAFAFLTQPTPQQRYISINRPP